MLLLQVLLVTQRMDIPRRWRYHYAITAPCPTASRQSLLGKFSSPFSFSTPSHWSIQLIFITPFKSISRKFSIVGWFFFTLFQLVKQENKKFQYGGPDSTVGCGFKLVFFFLLELTQHFLTEMHFMLGNVQFCKVFFFSAERCGFHWTGNERGRWL